MTSEASEDAYSERKDSHDIPDPEKTPGKKTPVHQPASTRSLHQTASRHTLNGSFHIDVEPQQQELDPGSEQRPPPIKVPRSQRRGWLGRFTVPAEVEEPKNYLNNTKWFITFVIAVAGMAAPVGSTIILRKRPLIDQTIIRLSTQPPYYLSRMTLEPVRPLPMFLSAFTCFRLLYFP